MAKNNKDSVEVNKFLKFLKFIYKLIVNIFTFLVMTIVVILAVGFATLNSQLVAVNYYVGTTQLSLSILLVVCVALGILLGCLALVPSIIQLKYFNRRLEKYIQRTEEIIEKLKASQSP